MEQLAARSIDRSKPFLADLLVRYHDYRSRLSLSQGEALRLVMLHFPSGLNLVTLFSTKPCQSPGFPNEQHNKETYLEIGAELAKCLNLTEEDGNQVRCATTRT